MNKRATARITITLPSDLLELADSIARQRSVTRSVLFAQLLEQEERAMLRGLMEEGPRLLDAEAQDQEEEALAIDAAASHVDWDDLAGE